MKRDKCLGCGLALKPGALLHREECLAKALKRAAERERGRIAKWLRCEAEAHEAIGRLAEGLAYARAALELEK